MDWKNCRLRRDARGISCFSLCLPVHANWFLSRNNYDPSSHLLPSPWTRRGKAIGTDAHENTWHAPDVGTRGRERFSLAVDRIRYSVGTLLWTSDTDIECVLPWVDGGFEWELDRVQPFITCNCQPTCGFHVPAIANSIDSEPNPDWTLAV